MARICAGERRSAGCESRQGTCGRRQTARCATWFRIRLRRHLPDGCRLGVNRYFGLCRCVRWGGWRVPAKKWTPQVRHIGPRTQSVNDLPRSSVGSVARLAPAVRRGVRRPVPQGAAVGGRLQVCASYGRGRSQRDQFGVHCAAGRCASPWSRSKLLGLTCALAGGLPAAVTVGVRLLQARSCRAPLPGPPGGP